MKRLPKILATLLTFALMFGIAMMGVDAAPGDQYPYDQTEDKDNVCNTNIIQGWSPTGSNNVSTEINTPRAQGNAVFTNELITVDGVRESAWNSATSYPISNKFNAAMTADAPDATTQGTLSVLWDGPVLYVLVEVSGDATPSDTTIPNWSSASYTPNSDGLFVFMDVFNDKWGMENDTEGVFFLGANPALTSVTSFNNGGITSLGSFFHPNNQDYSTRLKASKSSGYIAGDGVNYTYEIALQNEGWGDAWDRKLENGTQVGLEVGIFDQTKSFTYWSKTSYYAGREGSSNLPNSERVRNRDWGEITLSGWDGVAPFAYSDWRAYENIRFWNSKNNPGGSGNGTLDTNNGDGSLVWTAESKARMIAAKNAYILMKDNLAATRAEKESAVLEVCQAFSGLRWGDTTYPDPHNLTALNTLPNVWEFFDKTKGTNGMVTNAAEWSERKQELLDLAQFYEYGYKPQLGLDYTLNITSNTWDGTGRPSITTTVTPTNVRFKGGTAQSITFRLTMPTAGVPAGQKAPIAFGGSWTASGVANITYPSWASDSRSDNGAWGTPNRSGTFYNLFPYTRNSTVADSSIEIANATAVSVYLDILELAVVDNAILGAAIDPTRAVTKGFSIGGKIAFVSALYDERVKAVVCGGAGATGPANWRYNATGQKYNFLDTIFYNPGAESIIAHGTEGPGPSYRHNRVRETELFRHFMSYGHMFEHQEGSYGYGSYSKLPFDQALLVATFAPDRAIIIDTNLNDYNDGAVTDNMSLEIAKSVYTALGVNSSDYVKFNSGNYISSGDPHGSASAIPEGHYLSDLFYGTTTLTSEEANRLDTDPYLLNVSNGQTENPYDYYWGGFNTITGGKNGITGTDGWYYYDMDKQLLEFAIDAIEKDAYFIPYSEWASQSAKNAWLQSTINNLIPAGNGSTAIVSYDNGYTVSVTKGAETTFATINVLDTKNVTITGLAAVDREYNGETTVELTGGTLEGILPADIGKVTAVMPTSGFTGKNTGSDKPVAISNIILTGSQAFNYHLITPSITVNISTRKLIVTPDEITKNNGQPDPVLTFSYSGNLPDEIPSFHGALSRTAGEDSGVYLLTIGNLSLLDNELFRASNYALQIDDLPVNLTIVTPTPTATTTPTPTPTVTPTSGSNGAPQTGDPSASMLWILLGIAAIGILTSLIRKKRTDNASHH